MVRHTRIARIVFGWTAALAPCLPASAETLWKLYDLRDLISSLPPAAQENGAAAEEPGKNVAELMDRICGALNVPCTRLVDGVYGIEAEENSHAHLQSMLEGLRDLHRERYAVELVLFKSSADEAPGIGDETKPINCMHRQRTVIARRTPTRVAIVSEKTYQSGITPVVATGVVGYAPEATRVDDGLAVTLVVGADAETADGTSIKVSGDLRQVTWPDEAAAPKTTDASAMPLQHPLVSVRSVQSHLQIKYGKLIVLGVAAGFEEGKCFVLAASVRKL